MAFAVSTTPPGAMPSAALAAELERLSDLYSPVYEWDAEAEMPEATQRYYQALRVRLLRLDAEIGVRRRTANPAHRDLAAARVQLQRLFREGDARAERGLCQDDAEDLGQREEELSCTIAWMEYRLSTAVPCP